MPFGIPVSQDAAFGDLINGVEANIADLTQFGTSANKILQAGGAANAKDLSRLTNRFGQQLLKGQKANAVDLDKVSNALALQLAAGTQANVADLAVIPPPQAPRAARPQKLPGVGPGAGPAASFSFFALYEDSLTETCHFVCREIGPNDVLPDRDPQTGYFFAGAFLTLNDCSTVGGNDIIENCPTAGINPQRWAVLVDQPGRPCIVETFTYHTDAQLDAHIVSSGLVVAEWESGAAIFGRQDAADIVNSTLSRTIDLQKCGVIAPPAETPPELPPQDVIEIPPPSGDVLDLTQWLPTGGFPLPGTPEFCHFMDDLKVILATASQLLDDWINSRMTSAALLEELTTYENKQPESGGTWSIGSLGRGLIETAVPAVTNVGSAIMDAIAKLIKRVLESGGVYLDTALSGVRSVWQLTRAVQPTCGSPAVFPLLALKWLLNTFRRVRLGTDFIIWATVDVDIEFGPFEQLLEMLIQYTMPVEIPGAAEATEAWLKGQIDTVLRDCIWQLHGLCPPNYLPYALASSERLTTDELLKFSYRVNWEDTQRDDFLKKIGWQVDFDRYARQELHWELPTIGDHLHWLSRNADDLDYVKRFGLLDGFSTSQFITSLPGFEDYQILTDTHGRDFWRRFGHDLTAQGMKPEVAANHYISHWIQPSPDQMREFVFRLRPGPDVPYTPFTPEDFDRILAEQDYAPLARKWFGDTLFRVPAISYIVGMYRQGVITEENLQSYHQDLGYTHLDSERFVGVDRLQKAKIRASEYHGWTPANIASGFVIGALTAEQVTEYLGRLGGTEQEARDLMATARVSLDKQIWMRARTREQWRTATRVQQGLQVGVLEPDQAVALLVGLGYPQLRAQGVVEAERANSRTAIVKQTVASVKRAFHDGYVIAEDAIGLLQAAGIVPQKIDEYMALWAIQNTPRRKRRTAGQIVVDLASGMMDTAEALSRLYNLGYDQADSMLYLADAQGKIVQRQARAQASATRDARSRAQQLARLERQARAQSKQLRAELNQIAPRSVLTKWLKRGLINADQFRSRLELLGYPDREISLYVADAPTQPTVAELQKMAKAKVIDEPNFRSELQRLGFAAVDIDHFARAAFPAPAPTPSAP